MREITIQEVVDALVSGDYQPGRYRLRSGDTYCPLGVAEDVAGSTWLNLGDEFEDEFGFFSMTCPEARSAMGEWGEFLNVEPGEGHNDVADILANANDDGDTFQQIAELIVELATAHGYDVHVDRARVEG